MNGSMTTPYMVEEKRVKGSPGHARAYLSAAMAAVNNSTALVDITGFSFSMNANEVWHVRCGLKFSNTVGDGVGGGTGFRVGRTVPSGAATDGSLAWIETPGAAKAGQKTTTGTTGFFDTAGDVSQGSGWAYLDILITNGATAGTVQIRYSQGTAVAIDLILNAKSWMIAHRISP